MSYPTAVHTVWQFSLVKQWCAGLAYKPGTQITPTYHEQLGCIQVQIDALLFDSTRPEQTRIVRGQSVSIPVPSPWDPGYVPSADVYAYSTYAAGPDLVAGPLLRIGRTTEIPIFLGLPTHESSRAERDEGHARFLVWLRGQLHELERHEADEWFRDARTGRPFFDPHAP